MAVGLRPSNMGPMMQGWDPRMSSQSSMQDFLSTPAMQNNGSSDYIQPLPQFDWAAKAAKIAHMPAPQATQMPSGFQLPDTSGSGGGYGIEAVLRALRQQESGGNYGAVNSGSGALGAYQIMPSNIAGSGGWDMEALNRNISTQQLLSNPALQDAIAKYKFGNYMNNYGVKGALSAWYSGDPNAYNSTSSQGNYPSIHDYVMQVLALMGRQDET